MDFCGFCSAPLPARLPNQTGRKRLYCNKFCFSRAKGYVKDVEKLSHCLFCGAVLKQIKGAGNPKRYCSREHAAKFRQQNQPKRDKVLKFCLFCKSEFLSARDRQVFCSNVCRNTFRTESLRASRVIPDFYEYECDGCSVIVFRKYRVTKGKFGRFCDRCRLKKRRARYRVKTVKRQSLTVKPSRLSCDEVAERDNYVCHICSELVDMSLPRTNGLGATVDHVIPLSKGGTDDFDNLRLAHWICNIRKGSKIYA
jgi:5-methylcytosine-specific restriction endonuclease McrA